MADLFTKSKKKKFSFFGAAIFLRPANQKQRELIKSHDVSRIMELARQNPAEWECLLMKRNYLDFSWDNIGGNNELNEFPAETMAREVREEVGWNIKQYVEVCRQWNEGILNGFLYVVLPTEEKFMEDNPPRIPCDEVQTVKYFNLTYLLKSDEFKSNVKGRIQAFIDGQSDFNLQ